MKLAATKPNNLAIVKDDSLISIGEMLALEALLPKDASMIDLISKYDHLKQALESAASKGAARKLDPKLLKPPIERPSKIWAAASNYKRGSKGLNDARGRGTAGTATPQEILERTFLKPPSAITGPEENIIIPKEAETIFPELELCVVIGKKARHLSKASAFDAIFGYTIMLDVTARGYGSGTGLPGTRCVRKGFETFAPIGPWITTKDEISDPHNLWMRLWVNGELTQSAKTDAMVNDLAALVSYLSRVTTLYPGDLITTGNPDSPEFQRQLRPGDSLKAEIDGIGAMNLGVAKES
ncbi:MAG TPA: fumarylacetoacetate hydrolase family protein [Candidatus Binatia bacterium]|nr:fumarylacetoacetate hydrolase family protein [Candidatus Binatia bacterium]